MLDSLHKPNLIIIGLGPHSKQFYIPAIKNLIDSNKVNLLLGLDLKNKEDDITRYLSNHRITLPMIYTDPFPDTLSLPRNLSSQLSHFVDQNKINGVIIATEPLVHYAYAKWALGKKLNILMDKPITTRMGVTHDLSQAKSLNKDYSNLLALYKKNQKTSNSIFSICVQRRYDSCHQKVIELIKEVADEFDAPVTSIQAMHADGQWRLPNEIVTQIYHPYCQGYGKCSHSGYHLFDIVYQYLKAGRRIGKWPDSIEAFTSFTSPIGFIKQFNEKDYRKYFGKAYIKTKRWSDKKLNSLYENYGEMDAFTILGLTKNGINIGNISINLLHNSFARRHWLAPGTDLYKGNGRVKHQYYNIQQGPFQNIQVHSYQSNDKHSKIQKNNNLLGGDNHFDIYVFRNIAMFKNTQQPLTIYNAKDILATSNTTFTPNQIAKEKALIEFVDFIEGKKNKTELLSNIDDHAVPVKIMSAIYQSNIAQKNNSQPIIKFKI